MQLSPQVASILTCSTSIIPQVAQDVWAQTFKYMADQKVLFPTQHDCLTCRIRLHSTDML